MTSEEILKMAKEAGLEGHPSERSMLFLHNFLRLERERISNELAKLPFGDTAASYAIYVRNL